MMHRIAYFTVEGTRTRDIESMRLLVGGRIGDLSVSAYYPVDAGRANASPEALEPGLEEMADEWLEEHREAMRRLAAF